METLISVFLFIILVLVTGAIFVLNTTRKKWNNLDAPAAEAEELRPLLGVVRPGDGKEGN